MSPSSLQRFVLTVSATGLLGAASLAALGDEHEPAWAQGRSADMADSPLSPHATPLTTTPREEIPLDHLRMPDGFNAEIWAHGMPGARMMALGDEGTLFIGTRGIGRVYAVRDNGDEREHVIVAEGLTQPNGVAFKDGSLYVAAINRIFRYDDIESHLANGDDIPEPEELTDAFGLPDDEHHGWKFLAFGPDGRLYVPVGAPCNGCEVDPDTHATIHSFEPDGSDMRVEARGVRNSVGFDFHPETDELWFTDNNQDWIGEHGPGDELNRLGEPGEHFGFPVCHSVGMIDPELGSADACDDKTLPAAVTDPHSAPLGMRFYTGEMFPEEYRNAIFIARRGSWNRTLSVGYDVLVAKLSEDGRRADLSPFMVGLLDPRENAFSGRPVDVLQMPDGALLVSDEQNGAIYRISYETPSYME
ncbi:PQQ-dependent sugar dehydrogenase [Halomonas sp. MCCC 1A11057]|jgi:glucose/arabinose dehydrogenase|uniref:PQQ-dependent sugar dehydrogenase n=1 Tax=Halomonas sp. MCCC 1A11057 TaxID=2733482 RepID=UPI001F188B18|nr:PQQ-dependent sugar dehydrogenase [Halomonas sp. MCCC 1A11057]MCE8034429.1 sorbosone dehydrogenase family protein [Halomonas sp. MCCC 1A11057]